MDYSKLIGDGRCVVCSSALGAVFVRVRVDRGVVNAGAVGRHRSLTQFFGGSVGASALAGVFSPDPEPWVKFTGDQDGDLGTSLCLCSACYGRAPIDLAVLEEAANQARKSEGGRDGEDHEETQSK